MKPKVYVTRLLPEEAMERIRSFCDTKVWEGEVPPGRQVLLEHVRDVEGLLCLLTDKVDAELMNKAPKLRVVSNYAVGYDNVDVVEATRRGIIVTNTPDVLTETAADLAFALMMAAARRIVEGDKLVRAGNWKTWGPLILLGQDIHGATLGIIGFGRIGRAVARRAQGFGMKSLYYDLRRADEVEKELGVEYAEFERLLTESDFVTVHTNLTTETHNLIGAKELARMKKTAVLVNTARGPIVDNIALFEALRDRKIAFAALDVTEPEPIPSNHPLLSLSNVIITPHIASATVATRTKMGLMAADNLISGLKGQIPPNPVNPEILSKK
ncbi:MAG: D-glycerate dehydrogenase [Candidatus Bathyarchaeia archaeon]|jgi:glyoxylate reductase